MAWTTEFCGYMEGYKCQPFVPLSLPIQCTFALRDNPILAHVAVFSGDLVIHRIFECELRYV